jgi:hypothetical protein
MCLTVTDIGAAFDSRAEYVDAEGESSLIASCDIYGFNDGSLATITSYTVEQEGSRAE